LGALNIITVRDPEGERERLYVQTVQDSSESVEGEDCSGESYSSQVWSGHCRGSDGTGCFRIKVRNIADCTRMKIAGYRK